MTTETFRSAEGRRVVSLDDAEPLGSVRGFVLDVSGRTIEAIHVDGNGRRARLLEWSAVSVFGADAVMAAPGTEVTPVENEHQRAAAKGDVQMLGARVLTVHGHRVGTVADVEFDPTTGHITSVLTDQGAIEAARVRSLGSYALVVDTPGEASP